MAFTWFLNKILDFDFPYDIVYNVEIFRCEDYADYNSAPSQVWTFVQSCLILFSLATGIIGASSTNHQTFLRCIGRQEAFRWSDKKPWEFFFFRYNFSNFYKPTSTNGAEFRGPIWTPMRLLPNIPIFLFVLVVPTLYGIIYRFRKKHSTTSLGWYILRTKLVRFFLQV